MEKAKTKALTGEQETALLSCIATVMLLYRRLLKVTGYASFPLFRHYPYRAE